MSDTFGETLDDRTGKFKKTVWLTLPQGEVVIRILDSMETKKYGHWFEGRGWIECLGDECPVCQNNKKILYEHPEDYQKVSGWNARRARFFLNVLDRTDGQVKVLGTGPRLIEDIKVMSKAIRNESDERVDIRHYDWILITSGERRDKKTTPAPKFYGKETVEELKEGVSLYDLNNLMIRLEPDEMLDVVNGASLKDVFALRRAKKEVIESEFPLSEDLEKSIESAVDEMFGK